MSVTILCESARCSLAVVVSISWNFEWTARGGGGGEGVGGVERGEAERSGVERVRRARRVGDQALSAVWYQQSCGGGERLHTILEYMLHDCRSRVGKL